MNISISIGNFLYKYFPFIYKYAYTIFKNRQDKNEIKFLRNSLKQGNHVLDIGANIGFYSKIIADCVGEAGKVYSFEPDKINFNYLSRNTNQIKNIQINNLAVGSKTETIKIYTSNEINVDHRTYPVDNYKSVYEIDAIAIDDFIKNDEVIHFIKMDIQGFEIEALNGMKNLINRCKPSILLEFWPHGIEASGNTVEAYFEILEEFGYTIQLLENGKVIPLDLTTISRFKGQPKEFYYNIFLN